jgi:hypothetical protein
VITPTNASQAASRPLRDDLGSVAERTFTPDEANSALRQVRPLAERMVELRARLAELEDEQREVVRIVAGNGSGEGVGDARTPEFAKLARELQEVVDELALIGVQVKDADTGLLDFPALREGEDVLLCWRVGEPAVEWYHGLEDGFAGRRRIDW